MGPADYSVVEALASRHNDGRLTVLLINKSLDTALDVFIRLQSQRSGDVTWALLNSRDPSVDPGRVTNSVSDQTAVAVTTSQLTYANPLPLTLPAHSVSMVVLPP